MIYLTGDTHANFSRFLPEFFKEQNEMTKDDIVIVLGDFGGIWAQENTKDEDHWLNYLNERSFTLCYIDGNHENYDRYYSDEFPIVDFHGGKAHQIRDSIYHLMRGYIFNFEDRKFFCMGGAQSHDIRDGILDPDGFATEEEFKRAYGIARLKGLQFRIKHYSWWEEEIPSNEELWSALYNLRENNYKVDYVLTHCLPQEVASLLGFHNGDKLTRWFNDILQEGLDFNSWWCGHYHMEKQIMGRFNILYKSIVRII